MVIFKQLRPFRNQGFSTVRAYKKFPMDGGLFSKGDWSALHVGFTEQQGKKVVPHGIVAFKWRCYDKNNLKFEGKIYFFQLQYFYQSVPSNQFQNENKIK